MQSVKEAVARSCFAYPIVIGLLLAVVGHPIGAEQHGGESLRFERLSITEGLSQSTVNTMAQDSLGFLWLGTQEGLNRYDGYEFRVYRHRSDDPTSLGNSFVWDLHVDSVGDLWIGTEKGLDRRSAEGGAFEHFEHDPSSPDRPDRPGHNSVRVLLEDRRGFLWLGMRGGGLDRFDPRDRTFRHYRHDPENPESLGHDDVRALAEDGRGRLWVATAGGGLSVLDPDRERFSHHRHDPLRPASLAEDHLRSLWIESSGVVWIGTATAGLDRYDPKSGVFEHFAPDPTNPRRLAHEEVSSLYEDDRGVLWVGTDGGGLHRLDRESGTFWRAQHQARDQWSPSNDYIRALFQDRRGIFWVGTDGGGVNKLDRRRNAFEHHRHVPGDDTSLIHNMVFSILEDRQGTLWTGTWGGLDALDRRTGLRRYYRHRPADPHSLADDEVWQLLEDRSGRLWIGTSGGLDRWDPATERFVHTRVVGSDGQPGLSSHNVRALLEDSEGILWVGTDRGLDRYDPDRDSFESFRHDPSDPHSLAADAVWTLYEDRRGRLWVGTVTAGLDRFDRRSRHFVHHRHQADRADSLSSDYIRAILEDSTGQLWVGTDNGLNRFDPETGRSKRYGERAGLPNNVIYTLVEDDQKLLWMSTNRGLARFDPANESARSWDVSDGLQSNEFNTGAAHRNAKGELFFGGVNGLNIFRPSDLKIDRRPPRVVLTSFSTFHREVDLGRDIAWVDAIELGYGDYQFSFELAALDYRAPQKNRFAYQLEGLDEEWIELGTLRRITFTTLSPGSYTLRVRGSNGDGVWSEPQTAVSIEVLPAPWMAPWAKALYLVAGLVLARALLLLHRRRVARERALQEARSEALAAAAANRAKSQFLANMSHEIRTPMGAILGVTELLTEQPLPELARQRIAVLRSSAGNLLRILDDILDLSKIEAGDLDIESIEFALRPTVEAVFGLLESQARDKGLDYVLDLGEGLPENVVGDPTRLSQILYNLLGNAIKFTRRGVVSLSVERVGGETVSPDRKVPLASHESLVFRISDTGIGIAEEDLERLFEPFTQADASTSRQYGGTGLGLTISRHLSEKMGGELSVESRIGEGTIFELFLPFPTADARADGSSGGDRRPVVEVAADPSSTATGLAGYRILLAEDVPTNQLVATALLERFGCRVEVAQDGAEAVELFSATVFDLVLMDCQMPVLDGYQAAERIRQIEGDSSRTPIIALTAHAMSGDRDRCLAAGMDDYLSKPFRADELERILRHWLEP